MRQILAWLLAPVSLVYHLVTALRNHLYNISYSRSFEFDIPIVAVGNLEAGGSGKTPMVEYLVHLLKDQHRLATLSRGYGRQSKGFLLADQQQTPTSIGDEPYQYYRKFAPDITVAVGEERAWAIPSILLEKPDTRIILMDDAFQHRKVKASLNILLTRFERPFYQDCVLPSGRLRESRAGARRADIVVVTKCPDKLSGQAEKDMVTRIHRYTGDKPVFFSRIGYQSPQPFFAGAEFRPRVILFSGIAHPDAMENYVQSKYDVLQILRYPDHHHYRDTDYKTLMGAFAKHKSKNPVLLTSEKDMVKIVHNAPQKLPGITLFYLPIKVEFLKNGQKFDSLVEKCIREELHVEQ